LDPIESSTLFEEAKVLVFQARRIMKAARTCQFLKGILENMKAKEAHISLWSKECKHT